MIIKKKGKFQLSYVIAPELILVNGYEANGEYPTYCIYNGNVSFTNEFPFLTLAMNSVMKGYSSAEPDWNHNP